MSLWVLNTLVSLGEGKMVSHFCWTVWETGRGWLLSIHCCKLGVVNSRTVLQRVALLE